MKQVSVVIVGGGSRGSGFASFAARNPEMVRVVGIAEPRDAWRNRIARDHGIKPQNAFTDWRDLARRGRLADAAIIATQDSMHVGPAVALSKLGYAILLEKPMAPDAAGCEEIVRAVKASGIVFSVAHVLRYTPYTRALKAMIDSGAVGEIMCVQHLEPVGYWHQAHSYVRGNWRKESEGSSMLLTKSCHDLDWIRYIMGEQCIAVSSFGSLLHFRKENTPRGAGDRCLECSCEPTCPYSAKKIYMGRVQRGETDWPVNILAPEVTVSTIQTAIESGPYGRCVYACDNDVVDSQVVTMLFQSGKTASFTMTAFSAYADRKTHVFGTRGELYGDGTVIRHVDFLTDTTSEKRIDSSDFTIVGGHSGGDDGLTMNFISAVRNENPREILTGVDESLESHQMVFCAERARKENRVVRIPS